MAGLTCAPASHRWGPRPKYGYGFGDFNFRGRRMVGHTGGAPGINAARQMLWDDGYTIIVMSHYDRGASPLADGIRDMIIGPARLDRDFCRTTASSMESRLRKRPSSGREFSP
jgi:hypothetical protein